jgi:multidrug efflux pump subunit AcrB
MLNGVASSNCRKCNLSWANIRLDLYDEKSNQPVNIVMKLSDADKANQDITSLKVKGQQGKYGSSDLVKVEKDSLAKTIYRKDQKRVAYVLADMAGGLESPAYAILGMEEQTQKYQITYRLQTE